MTTAVTTSVQLQLQGDTITDKPTSPSQYTRTPTTDRIGGPGSLPLTTAETVVAFVGLVKVHEVKIKNTGASGVVQYGPTSGGAMILLGELNAGEENLVSLARSATPTLRLRMVSGTGTATVDSFDD